ncbi:hypothetical protein [Nakamurella leprariae]|uniref:Uncharacterized protein n=1 Tax=Nakamurella leprariae TaxID=2803911 RepID=A0A938Y710_9ACTN|nr:hypothetical protein [Nakamurella leprariae]MBM9466980.1 hypothetical protein [Nakamurella leprariae]
MLVPLVRSAKSAAAAPSRASIAAWTARRRAVAGVAAVGALATVIASFLPWISAPTVDGGRAVLSGWGGISGDSQLAGSNLNDALAGAGSYRPGMIGVLFGAIGILAALGLAVARVRPPGTGGTARPLRIPAALLVLCGVMGAGWGGWRGIAPGDAGVFDPGEAGAAVGPWLTLAAGLVMIGAAVVVFTGRVDPPVRPAGRAIQPR